VAPEPERIIGVGGSESTIFPPPPDLFLISIFEPERI